MINNSKYVSVATVIERVYFNAGYQKVDWIEALEHIGSAIRLIGLPQVYLDKITDGSTGNVAPLEVVNFKCELPYDIVYIKQCRDYLHKIPMLYSLDNFHLNQKSVVKGDISLYGTDYTDFANITEADMLANPIATNSFFNYKSTHETETINYTSDRMINGSASIANYQLMYNIQGGWMTTNFERGLVEVSYKAFATDSEGLPLIPDDEKFIRALEKYLIERVDYKLWRRGQLGADIYQHSSQERDWAIAAAKSHGNIPSIDEMESWKNMWVRLIPVINAHSDGFKSISIQERRFFK